MFAIAFDMVVRELEAHHPKGVQQGYAQVAACLQEFGFERVQGSVFIAEKEDLATLFAAITALKSLSWFPPSVRDLRAFRVEQWSDFTATVKAP